MSDRLTDLQRQRALIHGHLVWLDQEIAAAGKTSASAPVLIPAIPPATPAPVAVPEEEDAATILEKFGTDTKDEAKNARKGCLRIFILGMVLLTLCVYGLLVLTRSRQDRKISPAVGSPPAAPANH